jgi:PPP family 3-phenylpropionic acid transporter
MHKDVSNTMIGFILMLNSFASLIAQPLWGMVSDKIRSVKKVFLLCISVSTIIILTLPIYNNVGVLAVILPLLMFFFSPMSPLLDSWTIQGIKNDAGKSYGSVRLWGSVGFSIMVVFIGKLVNNISINSIFVVFGIMSCITIIICYNFSTPKSGDSGADRVKSLSFKELNIGRLFKNYYYVTFLVLSFFLFMTLSSVNSFLPKLMQQVGGNDALYGLATAVSAFSEAPVLHLSKTLIKKYKPLPLILAAVLVYTLRLFIYSAAASPMVVIIAQALQGFSYGLFLSGTIHYIDYLAPDELKATAQTTGNAVFFGLSGIIGNYATGRIIDSFGISFAYRVGAFIDIGVFILFLLSLFVGKRLHERKSPLMRYTAPLM